MNFDLNLTCMQWPFKQASCWHNFNGDGDFEENTVTGTETMKTEPFSEVKEPNKEQDDYVANPAKDIEIEAVAEENGSNGLNTRRIDKSIDGLRTPRIDLGSDGLQTRRIDNGMVVRNKRLGGRSPTVIRRFGKFLSIMW